MRVQQLDNNNKFHVERLRSYEVGGDCRLRSCGYLYFFCGTLPSFRSSLAPLFLLRSFISESIRSDPARGIARIRKYQHVCVCVSAAPRGLSRPSRLREARIARFVLGGTPLIDHCINNNSTIIVIYRDVLPSTPLQHGPRGRCMRRKVYSLISRCNVETCTLFSL